MTYSLEGSRNGYNLSCGECVLSLVTLSGIPYAKRHWQMAKHPDCQHVGFHRFVAVVEAIPIAGGLLALIERIVYCAYNKFFKSASVLENRSVSLPKVTANQGGHKRKEQLLEQVKNGNFSNEILEFAEDVDFFCKIASINPGFLGCFPEELRKNRDVVFAAAISESRNRQVTLQYCDPIFCNDKEIVMESLKNAEENYTNLMSSNLQDDENFISELQKSNRYALLCATDRVKKLLTNRETIKTKKIKERSEQHQLHPFTADFSENRSLQDMGNSEQKRQEDLKALKTSEETKSVSEMTEQLLIEQSPLSSEIKVTIEEKILDNRERPFDSPSQEKDKNLSLNPVKDVGDEDFIRLDDKTYKDAQIESRAHSYIKSKKFGNAKVEIDKISDINVKIKCYGFLVVGLVSNIYSPSLRSNIASAINFDQQADQVLIVIREIFAFLNNDQKIVFFNHIFKHCLDKNELETASKFCEIIRKVNNENSKFIEDKLIVSYFSKVIEVYIRNNSPEDAHRLLNNIEGYYKYNGQLVAKMTEETIKVYLKMGSVTKARKLADEDWISLLPGKNVALYGMILDHYIEKNNLVEAYEFYQKIEYSIGRDKLLDSFISLTKALLKAGEIAKAATVEKTISNISKEDGTKMVELIIAAYVENGEFEKAIAKTKTAPNAINYKCFDKIIEALVRNRKIEKAMTIVMDYLDETHVKAGFTKIMDVCIAHRLCSEACQALEWFYSNIKYRERKVGGDDVESSSEKIRDCKRVIALCISEKKGLQKLEILLKTNNIKLPEDFLSEQSKELLDFYLREKMFETAEKLCLCIRHDESFIKFYTKKAQVYLEEQDFLNTKLMFDSAFLKVKSRELIDPLAKMIVDAAVKAGEFSTALTIAEQIRDQALKKSLTAQIMEISSPRSEDCVNDDVHRLSDYEAEQLSLERQIRNFIKEGKLIEADKMIISLDDKNLRVKYYKEIFLCYLESENIIKAAMFYNYIQHFDNDGGKSFFKNILKLCIKQGKVEKAYEFVDLIKSIEKDEEVVASYFEEILPVLEAKKLNFRTAEEIVEPDRIDDSKQAVNALKAVKAIMAAPRPELENSVTRRTQYSSFAAYRQEQDARGAPVDLIIGRGTRAVGTDPKLNEERLVMATGKKAVYHPYTVDVDSELFPDYEASILDAEQMQYFPDASVDDIYLERIYPTSILNDMQTYCSAARILKVGGTLIADFNDGRHSESERQKQIDHMRIVFADLGLPFYISLDVNNENSRNDLKKFTKFVCIKAVDFNLASLDSNQIARATAKLDRLHRGIKA